MNKLKAVGLGILSVVGAYTTVVTIGGALSPDVPYAQGKAANPPVATGSPQPLPIKFSDSRTLTYKIGEESLTRSNLRGPVNVGAIYYFPDGGFEAGGNLGGFQFSYQHRHDLDARVGIDLLEVSRGDHTWKFFNYPSKGIVSDFAEIDGVKVLLSSPDFYETQGPKKIGVI